MADAHAVSTTSRTEISMRQPASRISHQRLLAASLLWLLGGVALLMSTLVPLHTRTLGWSPLLWLVVAPLLVLLVLEPTLLRQLVAMRRQRQAAHRTIWH
jgi:hypothetical protein